MYIESYAWLTILNLMQVQLCVGAAVKMAEQDGLVECFKKLYPKVDSADTPLPVSWNPKEKCNYLGLSANNLRVHYKGGISSPCLTVYEAFSTPGQYTPFILLSCQVPVRALRIQPRFEPHTQSLPLVVFITSR